MILEAKTNLNLSEELVELEEGELNSVVGGGGDDNDLVDVDIQDVLNDLDLDLDILS